MVPPDDQKYIGDVLTWIIAAKITWRVQGHHLGAKDTKATSGSGYQGFLQKVVGVRTIPGYDFHTAEGIQKVYDIVHPASTRMVTMLLYPECSHLIRKVSRYLVEKEQMTR